MRDLTLAEITANLVHGINVSFLYKGREIEDAKIIIEEDAGEKFVYLAQDNIVSPIEANDKLGYKYAYSIGWTDDLRLNLTGVKITRIGELNKKREVKKGMAIFMRGKDFIVFDVHKNIVFLCYPSDLTDIVRKHDIKLVLEEATFKETVKEEVKK